MQQATLGISGMSCGGCVSTVRKALDTVPGIRVDAVTVGSATVSYDESQTTPAAIAQVIRDAGYEPITAGAPVTAGAGGGCCCG
ncbi:MAG: heavy-metal-associated domain-containing protein [Gemmatimonadota bacterium]